MPSKARVARSTNQDPLEVLKAAYQEAVKFAAKDFAEVRFPAHHLLEYAQRVWRDEGKNQP